jgi:hypothetical protein
MKDASWTWLEELYRRIPLPYPVIAYFLFVLIYSVYWLFGTKVYWFEWNIYHNFQSLAVSLLIALLLAGMQLLLDKTRDTFRYIENIYENNKHTFYITFKNRFTESHGYRILLVSSVIAPFFILSWNALPYYHVEPNNSWALALDIYGYLLLFLILFLLSEILWLIINVVWSINELGCISQAISAKINIFSIGMKLRPIRNFLLIFVIYYFLVLALAISTYLGPANRFPYEVVFFSALLFLGAALFFVGLEAIQRIINCRVEYELNILYENMEEQHKQLTDAISKRGYSENRDEINYISSTLEAFQKERDNLNQINRRAYDLTAVGVFIGSFLVPLLTLFEKLRQLTL